MTFSKFLKGVGAVVAIAATAAAEAQSNQHSHRAAMSAEHAEAERWEKRRTEAHAAIERALERHNSKHSEFSNRTRNNKAIELRYEADTNCRKRSEPLMAYTEECIMRFERNGY